MRKLPVLMSILLLASAPCVFAQSPPQSNPTPAPAAPTKNIDATSNNKTVQVKAGTDLIITLDGNITTGFSWDVSSIQGTVTQTGDVAYEQQKSPPNSPPVLGRGGKFIAHFDCSQVGTSTINMEYKRPFERNKRPAQFFKVKVVVVP